MTHEELVSQLKALDLKAVPVFGSAEPVAATEVTEEHLMGFAAIDTAFIFKLLDEIANAGPWLSFLSFIPGLGPFISVATTLIPQIPKIKEFVTLVVNFINTFADKSQGVAAARAALQEAAA